jgi:hypothetical protein
MGMTTERLEVQRTISAPAAAIFRLLTDPKGHVAIDSSGMLMSATGDVVTSEGDTFVVHMDRESLNDFPLGLYDVTVSISKFEPDREIAWTVLGRIRPPLGHLYGYVLSGADTKWKDAGIFPVISESLLRATLGILARTVTTQ